MSDEKAPQVSKIETLLSRNNRAFVIFERLPESLDELDRLHDAIDVMRDAIFGVKENEDEEELEAEPEDVAIKDAPEKKQRKQYVLKKLPPCEKHPTSGRHSKTNRCLECIQDLAIKMHEARGNKVEATSKAEEPKLEVFDEIVSDSIIDTMELDRAISDQKKEFVFSYPVRCPSCKQGMVRLRRLKQADINRDYWIHPAKRCAIKIAHYLSQFHVDRDYVPTESDLMKVQVN